jgi:ribosome biogenesis GTPase
VDEPNAVKRTQWGLWMVDGGLLKVLDRSNCFNISQSTFHNPQSDSITLGNPISDNPLQSFNPGTTMTVLMRRPKKSAREKDLTGRYLSGNLDEDTQRTGERFGGKSKHYQQNKTIRTAELRAAEPQAIADLDALPLGEVVQVFSLFSEVQHDGTKYLCVFRKTMAKLRDTQLVVGDRVRFSSIEQTEGEGAPNQGIIERIEPRNTVLTRADSFKAITQHPIVANARQMLIVASLALPTVKWGLIDRMIVAAEAGGLSPIVCLNKADLKTEYAGEYTFAADALAHYRVLGVATLETSVIANLGLDALRDVLRDNVTVLAGHSGVGKSSLIRAIEPSLDLRVAAVSGFNQKGRHTTTSARRDPLTLGGAVIDTPGVKLFGLWKLTKQSLPDYFPDITAHTAPPWRQESYERILSSLPDPEY